MLGAKLFESAVTLVCMLQVHLNAARRLGLEGDAALAAFEAVAASHGLELSLLATERPTSEVLGSFRRWTADISIFEVRRQVDGGV